mmetsp:Transcript_1103/g.2529  ORF Transcript_1103/g.2529 Transcript_1103/m.2529 type:complete len:274 (-) Transcript_1103:527-1348(-)
MQVHDERAVRHSVQVSLIPDVQLHSVQADASFGDLLQSIFLASGRILLQDDLAEGALSQDFDALERRRVHGISLLPARWLQGADVLLHALEPGKGIQTKTLQDLDVDAQACQASSTCVHSDDVALLPAPHGALTEVVTPTEFAEELPTFGDARAAARDDVPLRCLANFAFGENAVACLEGHFARRIPCEILPFRIQQGTENADLGQQRPVLLSLRPFGLPEKALLEIGAVDGIQQHLMLGCGTEGGKMTSVVKEGHLAKDVTGLEFHLRLVPR